MFLPNVFRKQLWRFRVENRVQMNVNVLISLIAASLFGLFIIGLFIWPVAGRSAP
jgi:hypothetical protein